MSMHSLLGPSNSESFPEFDLVSTVKMAWLPPHVKYWISKLVKINDEKGEGNYVMTNVMQLMDCEFSSL